MRKTWFMALLVGLVGCEVPEGAIMEEDVGQAQAAATATNGVKLNGVKLNGVKLNGTTLNGVKLNGVKLNGVKLNGTTLSGVRLSGSLLVNSSGFPILKGTTFDIETAIEGVVGELMITEVVAAGDVGYGSNVSMSPSNSDVYLYRASYRVPKGDTTATWQQLCDGGYAIAVKGRWDVDNPGGKDPATDDSYITFSCMDGAIAKCIVGLGYKPWMSLKVPVVGGGAFYVDGDRYHQACVRMVRGDYCGNGWATTQDGTAIDVWDGAGYLVRTWAPYGFEGEWRPDGAACASYVRWNFPVTVEMPVWGCKYIGSKCIRMIIGTQTVNFGSLSEYISSYCGVDKYNDLGGSTTKCGSAVNLQISPPSTLPRSYVANASRSILTKY